MAILIKGMEMPKSCHDCEMSALVDVSDGLSYGCQALKEMIFNDRKRLPNCPLIPVPPHGLIDRGQILDSIRIELAQANAVNDMEDYDSWMRVFDYVRKFPTIIQTEEE